MEEISIIEGPREVAPSNAPKGLYFKIRVKGWGVDQDALIALLKPQVTMADYSVTGKIEIGPPIQCPFKGYHDHTVWFYTLLP